MEEERKEQEDSFRVSEFFFSFPEVESIDAESGGIKQWEEYVNGIDYRAHRIPLLTDGYKNIQLIETGQQESDFRVSIYLCPKLE